MSRIDSNQAVSNIIDTSTKQCNEHQFVKLIDPSDHSVIAKIFLPIQPVEDTIIWSHTRNVIYTVKSGY